MKRSPIRRKRPTPRRGQPDVGLAFPKPRNAPQVKSGAWRTYPDGREVCYTFGVVRESRKGRKEYRARLVKMLERQGGICCLYGHAPECPGFLSPDEATFEHENGRGGGKRDDRIEVDGRWINGAAHLLCNQWKGSRRIDYNTALQAGRPGSSPGR